MLHYIYKWLYNNIGFAFKSYEINQNYRSEWKRNMWKCVVCENENELEGVCNHCGYDLSCDYESFPTFTIDIPLDAKTRSRLKKDYQLHNVISFSDSTITNHPSKTENKSTNIYTPSVLETFEIIKKYQPIRKSEIAKKRSVSNCNLAIKKLLDDNQIVALTNESDPKFVTKENANKYMYKDKAEIIPQKKKEKKEIAHPFPIWARILAIIMLIIRFIIILLVLFWARMSFIFNSLW